MLHVRRRLGVSTDVIELAEYIARDNLDAALRFLDRVEETIKGLAEMPGKGAYREFVDPRLHELQSWAVDGFPNQLIFYRVREETLLVVAVLHGARDLPSVLANRE